MHFAKKIKSVLFDPKCTPIQLGKLKFKCFVRMGHPNVHVSNMYEIEMNVYRL